VEVAMENANPKATERRGLCLVCRHYAIDPPAPAVEPEGHSEREIDALCVVHRARASEGYCALCGRRAPWIRFTIDSRIGWCRPCITERLGEDAARRAEEAWADLEGIPEEE
jgi:hypothetical protein